MRERDWRDQMSKIRRGGGGGGAAASQKSEANKEKESWNARVTARSLPINSLLKEKRGKGKKEENERRNKK
jgi:hypothetical protein